MYAQESFLIVSLSIARCQFIKFYWSNFELLHFRLRANIRMLCKFRNLIKAIAMPSSGQVNIFFMFVFMLCLNSAVPPSTDGFWIFCESFAAFMRFIKEEEICLTFCLLSVTCMHVLTWILGFQNKCKETLETNANDRLFKTWNCLWCCYSTFLGSFFLGTKMSLSHSFPRVIHIL